jgi:hypothetical protein
MHWNHLCVNLNWTSSLSYLRFMWNLSLIPEVLFLCYCETGVVLCFPSSLNVML